jgi:hypothetical protein
MAADRKVAGDGVTAQELRLARKRRGWTQAEAAERLGVSQPYLALLEHGKRALGKTVARKRNKQSPVPWEQNTMVDVHLTTEGLSAMTLAIAHSRAGSTTKNGCPRTGRSSRSRAKSESPSGKAVRDRRDRRSQHRRRPRSPGGRPGASETRVGTRNAPSLSGTQPGLLRGRAVAARRSAASQPWTVLPR